jgi:hypothetical protein
VQTFGYRVEGGKVKAFGLNPTNKYLIDNNFERLYELIGDKFMNMLLQNYIVS